MSIFAQYVVAGLGIGGCYALLAMAIVVIFKTTDIANFAIAELGLLGTYVAYAALHRGGGYYSAIAVLVASSAALGFLAERGVIRRFLAAPHYITIMVTIALWYTLNSITSLIWGGSDIRSITPPFTAVTIIGSVVITTQQWMIWGAMLLILILLVLLFRTQTGLYMRAIAMDGVAPRLLGVSAANLSALAWTVGGAVAGIAVFLHAQDTILSTNSGGEILLPSFVAATLGGFQSILGAATGGLALGIIEELVGGYISASAQSAIALIVVLVILVVKPRGVFGEAVTRAA